MRTNYQSKKLPTMFPLWLSRLQTQLVSMMMQVQSLVLLGGLRIQCCCELWYRSQMLAQIPCCCGCGVGWQAAAPIQPPAWELPHAAGAAPKSKNKTKQKTRKGGSEFRGLLRELYQTLKELKQIIPKREYFQIYYPVLPSYQHQTNKNNTRKKPTG